VKTLVEQFCATGNVTGKKRGRSKPCVRTSNTCGTIRASVASSPTQKSVRQLAAENEVSPSTAWRILQTDLRMHPYKIHVFQSLTTVCREKLTEFAEEFGYHLQ
jgi:methylphosphotriester-DNA--protein-cysteine methyltransferase